MRGSDRASLTVTRTPLTRVISEYGEKVSHIFDNALPVDEPIANVSYLPVRLVDDLDVNGLRA